MKIDLDASRALLWFILKLALWVLVLLSLAVAFSSVFVLGILGFFVLALLVQDYIAYILIAFGIAIVIAAIWTEKKDRAEARALTKPPP
ncbi:MAG TPA: hypothetical protein VMC43_01395 [Candidatus Paceibacterota bacterium]|nr:hypothetical protein [Candidatus Paceibacterota bacterium]